MHRRELLRSLAAVPVAGLAAPALAQTRDFGADLAAAAIEQTKTRVVYDPAYVVIPYPGGDVPADRGVCADVIVRALRKLDADL